MMGVTSAAFAELVAKITYQPLAIGANCGVGASDLLRTVLGVGAASANLPNGGLPVIAKGNAGIPKYHDGHIHYDGTPALMGEYADLARDAGARIIGGCCGTMPEHLRAMHQALSTRPKGSPPELSTISEKLGAFSSASDGTDGDGPVRRERRRRS